MAFAIDRKINETLLIRSFIGVDIFDLLCESKTANFP